MTTRLRSIDAFRGAVLAFMVLTPATGGPETYHGLSLAFLLRAPVGRRRWYVAL